MYLVGVFFFPPFLCSSGIGLGQSNGVFVKKTKGKEKQTKHPVGVTEAIPKKNANLSPATFLKLTLKCTLFIFCH